MQEAGMVGKQDAEVSGRHEDKVDCVAVRSRKAR